MRTWIAYRRHLLGAMGLAAGCGVERLAWDYDQGGNGSGARFASLLLRGGD